MDKVNTLHKGSIVRALSKYAIYIVFIVLVIALSFASDVFLTVENIINVALQMSVIGTIAIGMTLVIIVQGIDVSVGAIVALAGVTSVYGMVELGWSPVVGLLVMMGMSLLVELFNGLSVALLKMPPFIVTLATMQIARGFANEISGGKAIYNLPELVKSIGNSKIGIIPLPIIIFVACAVVGYILLSKTVLGKQVYATGGNPKAAETSGINTKKITLLAFLICGVFVGIATVLITARMNCYFPGMGENYEFDAIAAVVIGGTSLQGGEGSIAGTIVGVFILGVINNALNLLGVSPFLQLVFKGLIIFVAVLIDTLKTKANAIK